MSSPSASNPSMLNPEIRSTIKRALAYLSIAKFELNRPNDHSVTMTVCMTARQAMHSFLRGYLLGNSIPADRSKSLINLLKQCQKADQGFETVSLKRVSCNDLNHKECESEYCLELSDVSACMEVANQIKALVLNKLRLNEAEFE